MGLCKWRVGGSCGRSSFFLGSLCAFCREGVNLRWVNDVFGTGTWSMVQVMFQVEVGRCLLCRVCVIH